MDIVESKASNATYTAPKTAITPGDLKPDDTAISKRLIVGKNLPVHPEYAYHNQCYSFWEGSYAADHKYKNLQDCDGSPVFQKHLNEPEQSAKCRKTISPVLGFCKPVVQIYNNFIFSSSIIRDHENEDFLKWQKDVDLYGTSFNDFVRNVSEQSQKLGEYFVLVDSTKPQQMMTEAQVKAAGHQVYLVKVHPSRLINWCQCDDEHYDEMLIIFPEDCEARYYTDEFVQIISYEGKNKKILSVSDPIPHGFPIIPVVKVNCDDDDSPQICSIAEYQKAIYHVISLLMEEDTKQVFTSWMVTGADLADILSSNNPDPTKELVFAKDLGNRKFTFIGKQAVVTRLSADTSQSQNLRDTIKMLIDQVYRASGLTPEKETGNIDSAKSLKFKFNQVANIARGLADHFEKAEKEILKLWSVAMNQTINASVYYGSFTDESLGVELQRVLNVLAANVPGTLKSAAIRDIAPRITRLSSEEQEQVGVEADAMYLAPEDAAKVKAEKDAHEGAESAEKEVLEHDDTVIDPSEAKSED